jgi:hypothetical protein
LLLSVFFG